MKNRQAAVVLGETSPARIFARPTAEDVWLGPAQRSALSHLKAAVGVRVLIGPPSSGRTTLLNRLAHETRLEYRTLRLAGRDCAARDVLHDLLAAAGFTVESLSLEEMRRLLDVFVGERLALRERVVVEIDDADAYGEPAWHEIERLRRDDGQGVELLVALSHLDDASSAAASFIRRAASPCLAVLEWMTASDVGWYLHWRLQRFGISGLFTPPAIRLLARCTEGRFAAVDCLSQMILLLLKQRATDKVDVMLVREAARALQERRSPSSTVPHAEPRRRVIVSRNGKVLRHIPLGSHLLIGRNNLNDLALESDYLSRHHAVIVRSEGGRYYLSDLNSVNGLLLNGRAVHSAPLSDGDVVCIGPFRIKMKLTEDLPSETRAERGIEGLADTVVMPALGIPEPAHLKIIK